MLTAGLPIAFAPLSGAAGTGVLAAEPTMGAFGALVAAATGAAAEVATPAIAPSQEQEVAAAAAVTAASGLEASRLIRPKVAAPIAEDSLAGAGTAPSDAPEPADEHEGLVAVAMAMSTESDPPEDTRSLRDADTDLFDPQEGAGTDAQLLVGQPVWPPAEPPLLADDDTQMPTADDDVYSPVVDYAAVPLPSEVRPVLLAPTNAEAGVSLRRFVQVDPQRTPIQNTAATTIPQQPPLLSPATMAASGVPEGEFLPSPRAEPNPYAYLSTSLPTVLAGQQVLVGADAMERKLVRNSVSTLGAVSPEALSAGANSSLTVARDPASTPASGPPANLAGQQVFVGADTEKRTPASPSVSALGSVSPEARSEVAIPSLTVAREPANAPASGPPAILAGQQIQVGADAEESKTLSPPANALASVSPDALSEVPIPSLTIAPDPGNTPASGPPATSLAGQQVFAGANSEERKPGSPPVSTLGSVSPDALSAGAIPSQTVEREAANTPASGPPASLAGQQVFVGANAEERKPVSSPASALGSVSPEALSAGAIPSQTVAREAGNTPASGPLASLAGQQVFVGANAEERKPVSHPVSALGSVSPEALSAGAIPSLTVAHEPANTPASGPPVLPADLRPVSPYGSAGVPVTQHSSAVAASPAMAVTSAQEPTVIDVRPVSISVTGIQQPERGEQPPTPLTDPRFARTYSLTSAAMTGAAAPIAVQQASSVLAGVEAPATGPVSRRGGGRSNDPAVSAPAATPAVVSDGQVNHPTDAIAFDVTAQDVMTDPAAPALDLSAPLSTPLPTSSARSGFMPTNSFAPGLTNIRPDLAGDPESSMEAFSALTSMRATRALANVVAEGREMTVRIEPTALGRIDMTVGFEANGTVRAVMAAAEPGTAELIRREAGAMAMALADSGVRADAQSIRVDPSSASGQSNSSSQNGGASSAFSGHAHDSAGGQPQQSRAPAVYGDSFAAALTGDPKVEAAAGPGRARLGDQSGRRVDLIA